LQRNLKAAKTNQQSRENLQNPLEPPRAVFTPATEPDQFQQQSNRAGAMEANPTESSYSQTDRGSHLIQNNQLP